MKYYMVNFTISVPVCVKDDDNEIDVYYEAKKKFFDYSVNEAKIKYETITEDQYNKEQILANKLHK